jgi:hypothetical protein
MLLLLMIYASSFVAAASTVGEAIDVVIASVAILSFLSLM